MYICYTDKYVYSLYEEKMMSNTDTEAQDKKYV